MTTQRQDQLALQDTRWYDDLVAGDHDVDALLSAEEDAHLDHVRPSAGYYSAVRRAYEFLTAQKDGDAR